jgi:hypothetical protein
VTNLIDGLCGWTVAPALNLKRTRMLLLVGFAFATALTVIHNRARGSGQTTYPEIISFKATPRVIHAGEAAELSWETTSTGSIAMEWARVSDPQGDIHRLDGLPPKGAMKVEPKESTIYILECEATTGWVCAAASATVRVE